MDKRQLGRSYADLSIGENARLFEEHIAAGNQWVYSNGHAYFISADGEYTPHPVGYIRGPHVAVPNGSPTPVYISVYTANDCWMQKQGTHAERAELVLWAINVQKEILATACST
jgi:hypothetical protein